MPFTSVSLFTLLQPWSCSVINTASFFSSLTVLLHALSVPRSLPPEGNDRLRLRLVVQGFHAACRIRTVAENAAAMNYIATSGCQRFSSRFSTFFLSSEVNCETFSVWKNLLKRHLSAQTAPAESSHHQTELCFNLNFSHRKNYIVNLTCQCVGQDTRGFDLGCWRFVYSQSYYSIHFKLFAHFKPSLTTVVCDVKERLCQCCTEFSTTLLKSPSLQSLFRLNLGLCSIIYKLRQVCIQKNLATRAVLLHCISWNL